MSATLLPLFLKLEGRRVVLVGGGPIAAGKLKTLQGTGAQVTVVAPALHEDFRATPGITIHQRPFAPSDLEGAWLVISAATPEVNAAVSMEANARRIFVVAVDHVEVSSAYAGGVIRKGDVTVSISTNGRAPALAGLLREALERVLPEDVSTWVDLGQSLRKGHRADGIPMSERRPLLLKALDDLYARRNA